jgi:D-glycero-D-manno-heptose 1,7-bisphosphate phosphatase
MKPQLKCVFFDRDGIVNQHPGPGYVGRWKDFHLLPEFVDVLRLVRQKGYVAVIVSNQRGVALGNITSAIVDDLHHRLRTVLKEQHGLELLDVFYCPHDRNQCECRKPKPGMLLEAARRHAIDLNQSWMIGDSLKDVEAGKAAGCRTVLVNATETSDQADEQVTDMAALRSSIAKILGGR